MTPRENYSGYYFVLGSENDPDAFGSVMVYITDAQYFDIQGAQSDWELATLLDLPDWLSEEMEGVFSSSYNRTETANKLLRMGFRVNARFAELILDI